jgi:hypothetical protein
MSPSHFVQTFAAAILLTLCSLAQTQTVNPKFEYLMTYEAELDLPQAINDKLFIYNVKPGGWVNITVS